MTFAAMGTYYTNAYANATSPTQPIYVRIDDAYDYWYRSRHGKKVDHSLVLHVLKALLGHSEEKRKAKLVAKSGGLKYTALAMANIIRRELLYVFFTKFERAF
jgi:hypothetical protein